MKKSEQQQSLALNSLSGSQIDCLDEIEKRLTKRLEVSAHHMTDRLQ
jgi:phage-related protein